MSEYSHVCATFAALTTELLQCSPGCLADVDPADDALDVSCSFDYEPDTVQMTAPPPVPCEEIAGVYQPPAGHDSCVAVLVDEPESNSIVPFPSACRDMGLNAAFGLFGTIPEGQKLFVQCQQDLDPEPPCPKRWLPLPQAPEPSCEM